MNRILHIYIYQLKTNLHLLCFFGTCCYVLLQIMNDFLIHFFLVNKMDYEFVEMNTKTGTYK